MSTETREFIQSQEYRDNGAYHRRTLRYIPFHPIRQRYNSALSLLPKNLHGFKFLDYGGGDGALSTLAADKGAVVMIFDRDQVALSYAQADKRLSLVRGQTYLPFRDTSFDIVTMLETLEHIKEKEEADALKETYRVLKPNGLLVLTVPSTNIPVSTKHYRHYDAEGLRNKLKNAGFTVCVQTGYRDPTLWLNGSLPSLIRKSIRASVYAADYALSYQLSKSSAKDAHGLIALAKKTNFS